MEGPSGVKTEQQKKSEVLRELQQLKVKIQSAEREKNTHIYNKHSDHHKEFLPLQEMENKMMQERKSEKIHLQQQLVRISGMVKKFQRELRDIRPTPEFLEKLKIIMEEIEGHISEYKARQREQYEEMMRDERLTSQEISALDKKFESWALLGCAQEDASIKSTKGGPAPLSHRDTPRDLPPEVQAFDRFLAQTGGPRGGWDEYDHSTFLKFRNRHKGKLSFLRELSSHIPTKTDVEVRQHEEWYQQYMSMNEKKKDAIQHWKERKEIQKDELVSRADKDQQREEHERQLQEETQKQQSQQEHEQQRAQLNKWKLEKELARAEDEEKKLRQQLEKAKAEEAWHIRQQQAHEKVEKFKKEKKAVEEERQRDKEQQQRREDQEKRRQAAELLPKFRDRDLSAVKKKKSQDDSRQRAESERKQRLEQKLRDQATTRVQRDPSRLLKPTAGWRERQKDQSPQGGGPVLHMPHRAVPTWRQGMH